MQTNANQELFVGILCELIAKLPEIEEKFSTPPLTPSEVVPEDGYELFITLGKDGQVNLSCTLLQQLTIDSGGGERKQLFQFQIPFSIDLIKDESKQSKVRGELSSMQIELSILNDKPQ